MIALVFAVYTAGYFLPNGGLSPGPRFATAALPFLLLGLPFALARWRPVTILLAALSVGVALFDELTWSVANSLRFLGWPKTTWSMLGLSPEAGCIVLLACGGGGGAARRGRARERRSAERPGAALEFAPALPL